MYGATYIYTDTCICMCMYEWMNSCTCKKLYKPAYKLYTQTKCNFIAATHRRRNNCKILWEKYVRIATIWSITGRLFGGWVSCWIVGWVVGGSQYTKQVRMAASGKWGKSK